MAASGPFTDRAVFQEILTRLEERLATDCDCRLTLCGFRIRLRFGKPAMRDQLTAALRRFQTGGDKEADLTVLIGDGSVCSLPEAPYRPHAFGRRSELTTDPESGILASFMMGPDILSMLDRETGTAIYWLRNGDAVPGFEQAAPFRHLFHWFFREHGWMLVHGAAIGRNGKGALVCGKGGSGKSTLAVATWSDQEWQFAGDDYCAVSIRPPHRVATIYPTAKLNADSAAMLDRQLPESAPVEGNKTVLMADDRIAAQIPDMLDIAAILIPVRSSGPTGCRIASRAVAARQLIVSTLYQMPHAGDPDHRALTELVRRLPAWEVSVTENNPSDALHTIQTILEHPGPVKS